MASSDSFANHVIKRSIGSRCNTNEDNCQMDTQISGNGGVQEHSEFQPADTSMGKKAPIVSSNTEVLPDVITTLNDDLTNSKNKLKETSNQSCHLDQNTLRDRAFYCKIIGKLFFGLLCGIIFGFALEKGRVFDPRSIRGQFIFTKFVMLKMFLAAGATSVFLMGVMSVIPQARPLLQEIRFSMSLVHKYKGLLATGIGAFILGAGMQMSGSCPAMVLVQVGTWIGNGRACITLFAGLLAALTYGLIEPYLTKLTSPKNSIKKPMLDDCIPVSFFTLTLVLGVLMGTAVGLLEYAVPWQEDVQVLNDEDGIFSQLAWPPYITGIIVGCLQVPLIIVLGDTIGGSQSYCTVVSQVLFTNRLRAISPYLVRFAKGTENWWQVCYVVGAILGGLFSALASSSLDSVPGVGFALSFVGGFCSIFGARLAAGCTSGHGLSGIGCLSLMSFVAVPCMFAGGISVGFIMKYSVGSLDEYYSI